MASIPYPNRWERRASHLPDQHVAKPGTPDLNVTENPVKATLLGPTGKPIRQVLEREPFGYRQRSERNR